MILENQLFLKTWQLKLLVFNVVIHTLKFFVSFFCFLIKLPNIQWLIWLFLRVFCFQASNHFPHTHLSTSGTKLNFLGKMLIIWNVIFSVIGRLFMNDRQCPNSTYSFHCCFVKYEQEAENHLKRRLVTGMDLVTQATASTQYKTERQHGNETI